VKVSKTLLASVALHVLVLGWCIFSFAPPRLEATPVDSVAVDIVSDDQLAHVAAGMKTGKKENPKPLVEKVAEAKPVDDNAVGKISEKPPVVTDTTPHPNPSRWKSRLRKSPIRRSRSSRTSRRKIPSPRRRSRIRPRSIRSPRR